MRKSKTVFIGFRCTVEKKQLLTLKAAKSGKSLASYVRCCLGYTEYLTRVKR